MFELVVMVYVITATGNIERPVRVVEKAMRSYVIDGFDDVCEIAMRGGTDSLLRDMQLKYDSKKFGYLQRATCKWIETV